MIIVLIVNEETSERIEFPLLDKYVIGRDGSADITLKEKYVHDFHFRIELTSSGKVLLKTINQKSRLEYKNESRTHCFLCANEVVEIGNYKVFIDTNRISAAELQSLHLIDQD